jgi:uncharacterized membrane protein YeaQ/YmgE (transglycosylase-associated protein family)
MTFLFADIAMWPGGILAWLAVGLIAGWLAGQVMRGSGYGILGDLVLGLIGSVVGGFLVSMFVHGMTGFWGSIVVSFIGAVVLVAISRALTGGRGVPA